MATADAAEVCSSVQEIQKASKGQQISAVYFSYLDCFLNRWHQKFAFYSVELKLHKAHIGGNA